MTAANFPDSPSVRDTGISSWLRVSVRGWQFASLLVALTVLAPMLVVASAWWLPADDVWPHLAATVLPTVLTNTLIMLAGVGFGVLLLGVGLAWVTSQFDFPGRRFFEWALMLPLAIPAYVLAFIFAGLFDYAGPIHSALRVAFGSDTPVPSIRNGVGVGLAMTLAFYPYVYMLARTAFESQGRSLIETARVFGLGPRMAFFKVALPMARPAIAAGAALALMEALADFGTVSIFNFDTFTTAIYKSWLGLFSLPAAAQLASLLLLFVAIALLLEQRFRRRARFDTNPKTTPNQRYRLKGGSAVVATTACLAVFAIAFAIPVAQMAVWSWQTAPRDLDARYLQFLGNTLSLGVAAAVLTTFTALTLAYTYRLKADPFVRGAVRFSTLGYALPGSVLAVGILLSFGWLDRYVLVPLAERAGFAGPVLAGGLVALILSYGVRFMAVAYGPVDASFERIRPSLWQAARSLGASNLEIIRRISIPLLRGGLVSAALLVLVEVMKEMPATLLLRPFGWDTLATRIFEMTAEGEWERAALPALNLVLAGLLPVILLVRRTSARGG